VSVNRRATALVTTITLGGIGQLHRNASIEALPDDAFLEIFRFYVDEAQGAEGWHTLIHVCRRWRNLIFASPRHLNLRLRCTERRPVREMLDIWPALPILVCDSDPMAWLLGVGDSEDNIIAALEHKDRVYEIYLQHVPTYVLEKLSGYMGDLFPALENLLLFSMGLILPDSFLGGSAPRLRTLYLDGVLLRTLPQLLLSAHDLVSLDLSNIPYSEYISPSVMVTCLSTLTKLQSLTLEPLSPPSLHDPDPISQHLPPPTRTSLPALSQFRFGGYGKYLEDLVAHISAPHLKSVYITFLYQHCLSDSQLPEFISCAEDLKAFDQADIVFLDHAIRIALHSKSEAVDLNRTTLEIKMFSDSASDSQISCLAQIGSSTLLPLSTLEHLHISGDRYYPPYWLDDIENSQWLDFLYPFTAVRNLYLSQGVTFRLVPALQKLVGEGVDVLPTLQNLFIEGHQPLGPVQGAIGQFVAARRLSDGPVAVHRGDGKA
jgi:hypothetical protein